MYVYNEYWQSAKALLVYPSNEEKECLTHAFETIKGQETHHQCGLAWVNLIKDGKLNQEIGVELSHRLGLETKPSEPPREECWNEQTQIKS